jgi:hypothetical protein
VSRLGIFSGAGWARWLGIFIAAMSIFVNFTFIPFEPWWALTIIFIDLWVIHALFVIDAYTTELMSAENRGRQRRRAYVFDPARPGRPRIDLTDRGRRRRQPEPVRR